MVKNLLFALIMLGAIFSGGCSEKTGALNDSVGPNVYSYVNPTIANLQVVATSISKSTGGIVRLNCEWTTPGVVSTATAYLGFVRTIQDYVHEPVGVIGSDTATLTRNLPMNIAALTASAPVDTSNPAAFYERFKNPIAIPTKIGTTQLSGLWSAEIPLPNEDIFYAPLGVHQMVFYMSINGVKTNTLSFEMTFVP